MWLLILWWVMFFSPFGIPELIPYTPIKTYGLFFTGMILTILIFAEKKILRNNPQSNIINLTLSGTVICFIMEVIFQVILSFTESSDKLYYFIKGVTTTTILCAFLSFFIAFQLKTRRTKRLLLLIGIFVALFKILTLAFPSFMKS